MIIFNRTSVLCNEEMISGHGGGMNDLPEVGDLESAHRTRLQACLALSTAQVQGRKLRLRSTM